MARYKSLAFLGFPGYQVGDDGFVWSRLASKKGPAGVWRRMGPKGRVGRPYIILCNGPQRKGYAIYQLVLLAFVGPCPNGMEPCHQDGNYHNNCLTNLRWDTHANNERDKKMHGTSPAGENNGNTRLTDAQIHKLHDLWENGWSRKRLALKYSISKGYVDILLRGDGRRNVWKEKYPEGRPKELNRLVLPQGEQNGNAKLKESEVLRILQLYATGKWRQVDLARKFDVTQTAISGIIRGGTWFDVYKKFKAGE